MNDEELRFWANYGGDDPNFKSIASLAKEVIRLKKIEPPEQAWARAATLMRSAIQTHGKLADDDPAWGIDIPEYRPPGAP